MFDPGDVQGSFVSILKVFGTRLTLSAAVYLFLRSSVRRHGPARLAGVPKLFVGWAA